MKAQCEDYCYTVGLNEASVHVHFSEKLSEVGSTTSKQKHSLFMKEAVRAHPVESQEQLHILDYWRVNSGQK